MNIELNDTALVELSVRGEITQAVWPKTRPYRVGADGKVRVLPGTGGICYSHLIGDSAIALQADHVEPCVTIRASDDDENAALNIFACVGNQARVISGDAKGSVGTVTGKHGGVEHVMVDFALDVLENLAVGDKIQIRAKGVGVEAREVGGVQIMNSAPELLRIWLQEASPGNFTVPVTHLVPAKIMGSGLGAVSSHSGDYDIQMFDEGVVEEYNLRTLRFGDLVAILDADHTFGRRYLSGATSIGVVVHSRSDMSGHGPGVTTLITSSEAGLLRPRLDPNANIGKYLGLGRWRQR